MRTFGKRMMVWATAVCTGLSLFGSISLQTAYADEEPAILQMAEDETLISSPEAAEESTAETDSPDAEDPDGQFSEGTVPDEDEMIPENGDPSPEEMTGPDEDAGGLALTEEEEAAAEDEASEEETADPEKDKKDNKKKTEKDSGKDTEEEEDGKLLAAAGEEITGSFPAAEGMDIATIRYFTKEDKSMYAFSDFLHNEDEGVYTYSFKAPYDGFEKAEGTEDDGTATVIAEYYTLSVWDGAVDVSWYDPSLSEYHIYNPAQFAGFAAIVNGSIDSGITNVRVKGTRTGKVITDKNDRSFRSETSVYRGLPDCIEYEYQTEAELGGPVVGPCYAGLEKNDFLNKTVWLEADLDMGGGDGAVLDTEGIYEAAVNLHDGAHEGYDYYPNWTPIGGLFLSNLDDPDTAVQAAFNGVLEGNGHSVNNLYCYRWSYPKPGTTAYGYTDSTGLVGRLGYLYSEEEGALALQAPAIRNLGLSGFVMGRRSVGGILGRAGSGTYYKGAIYLENLANHATVYATDSKGVGGIVGTFWNKDIMDGSVLQCRRGGAIINCYNTGTIRQCEYNGPAAGILGENDSADLYSCYSTGVISSVSKKARGIGSNDAGTNYTVDQCYYLEGNYDCDVEKYYGYYYENAAASVSINTEKLSAAKMTDGTMLALLNSSGTAYYEGEGGYPILAWEAGAADGSLSFAANEGGTAYGTLPEGSYPAGTVVYLGAEPEEGWVFRYFNLNDVRLPGNHVTVNGGTTVSAFCQKSGKGYLEVPANPVCDIVIYRVTGEEESGYEYEELHNGDEITEGDKLAVEATVKEGTVPADPDLEYRADAGVEQPFLYTITYTGQDPQTTYVKSITVSDAINGDDVLMKIEVEPLTTEKRWKNYCDTSWYEEGQTAFTITNARQLAGVDKLIETEVTDFAGVTLTLGNDISLENADGSAGVRYWDGIGNKSKGFSGIFDGAGYKITDISGCEYGLFTRLEGKSVQERAVVKDLEIHGVMTGYNASGIAGYTVYSEITGCINYCTIDGSNSSGSSYHGGITGQETLGCVVADCINYAPVSGVYRTGGIVGESSGTGSDDSVGSMTGCLNYGDVIVPKQSVSVSYAGGLAGVYKGSITGCANYGDIVSLANYTGGLAGYMVQSGNRIFAKITDSYNAGSVYSASAQAQSGAGGLLGNASRFVITNCFNTGSVSVSEESTAMVGNFAGRYTANDNNRTADVYLLDDENGILLNAYLKDGSGTGEWKALNIAELTALAKVDLTGIRVADAEIFASAEGVLAAVNGNGSFTLVNGTYPELLITSDIHVHSGGTATCSHKALCDECGLPYGKYDPDNHEESVLTGKVTAEWMQDGYSGDVCCSGCGEIIVPGETVPADTTKEVFRVTITDGETVFDEKIYSVAEFDALKETETVGYQYGNKNGVDEICIASNRYVTLEALLADRGYEMDDLVSAYVTSEGSFEDCSKEILLTRNLYLNPDGTTKTVPAAIGIYYDRQSGTAEEVVQNASYGPLIFLTGLYQSDIDADSVGGFRLIMPVVSIDFKVQKERVSIKDAVVDGIENKVYTGEEITQDPVVKLTAGGEEKTLEEGTDYTVSYSDNIDAGTASFEIKGRDGYSGSIQGSFAISPKTVVPQISLDPSSFTYSGKVQKPAVKVSDAGNELAASDYDFTWPAGCKNAGTYEVSVSLKGNYMGTGTAAYTIAKAAQPLQASLSASSVAVGKTAKITASENTGKLSYASADTSTATVSSSGKITAKKAGKVKITVRAAATDNYKAVSKTLTVKVVPAATTSLTAAVQAKGFKLTWKKVADASGYYIYRNGTKIKKITSGSTVTYTDTKAAGNGTKYTYKITAFNSTTGTSTLSKSKTVYFVTRPAVSSAVSSTAKKVLIKWKKNTKASGYQIRYSLKSSFASGNKTVTVSGANTVSKTIGSLKSGRTYYVQIRTFKTAGGVKYYSAWSEKRSVKVR